MRETLQIVNQVCLASSHLNICGMQKICVVMCFPQDGGVMRPVQWCSVPYRFQLLLLIEKASKEDSAWQYKTFKTPGLR